MGYITLEIHIKEGQLEVTSDLNDPLNGVLFNIRAQFFQHLKKTGSFLLEF